MNTSSCQKQVLTDITGVYIGGIPDTFLTRDESQIAMASSKVQQTSFSGCLRNLTTLMEFTMVDSYEGNTAHTNPTLLPFAFEEDAEYSEGEPQGSNTVYGCPVSQQSLLDPSIYLMGFGYLYANVKQTMPLSLQSNQYFTLDIDFRTQQTTPGILFFNFDIEDDVFILVRMQDSRRIEICLKCRVR